jgi:hypothetical protein
LSKSDTSRRYLSIQVDTGEPNLIDEMKARIDSQEGKRIYARRLGIVEPVFANICVQKRMHRFTLRPSVKWMYNGNYLLWFTISAKFTSSGRWHKPSLSLFTPLHRYRRGKSERWTQVSLALVFHIFIFQQSRWADTSAER